MVTALAAIIAITFAQQKPLVCAVMNDNPVNAAAPGFEYAGAKFPLCCGGCPAAFKKNPSKFIDETANAGNTAGIFLFDAVTGARIDVTKSKISSDYKGIRYFFANTDEKASFDANPKKFTETPAKQSLVCAMSSEEIKDYGSAAGYVDYQGVRYYACCPDCFPEMKKDMSKAALNPKIKITEPTVIMGRNNKPGSMSGG